MVMAAPGSGCAYVNAMAYWPGGSRKDHEPYRRDLPCNLPICRVIFTKCRENRADRCSGSRRASRICAIPAEQGEQGDGGGFAARWRRRHRHNYLYSINYSKSWHIDALSSS
jgi:hypothetical protein